MGLKLKNDAVSRLASGISSSDTTIVLTPGTGLLFPVLSSGDYFPATLIKEDGSREIVRVTGRSSDVLTVVRAQESTVAQLFNANDKIELRLTAGTFTDPSGPSATSITSASTKEAPINTDLFGFTDSEDAFKLKKFTWANLKTAMAAGIKTTVLGYVYPVGSIYINASSSVNPSELLGVGTWEEIGAGRVLVGQNTGDSTFDTLGETGGSKDAIVIAHTHGLTSVTAASAGAHTHGITDPGHNHLVFENGYSQGDYGGPSGYAGGIGGSSKSTNSSTTGITINSGGAHTHSLSGNTDSTGSSGANANLQPYLVVKMWKRVA